MKGKIQKMDFIFGLRIWGLYLYGALPANLALLGLLEVKLEKIEPMMLIYVIPMSLLPIILTFLLIRHRQLDWYLTEDFLNKRSLIMTIIILTFASLISGIAGLIKGQYILAFTNFFDGPHLLAISESYLKGVGSLILTSTLFIAVLTKNVNLPGVPSAGLITDQANLRKGIRFIQNHSIWQSFDKRNIETVHSKTEELLYLLDQIMLLPGHQVAKQHLNTIRLDLEIFSGIVDYILRAQVESDLIRWEIYFGEENNLSDNQKRTREQNNEKYLSINRVKDLNLGGSNA